MKCSYYDQLNDNKIQYSFVLSIIKNVPTSFIILHSQITKRKSAILLHLIMHLELFALMAEKRKLTFLYIIR